jgi:ribosomal protein L36
MAQAARTDISDDEFRLNLKRRVGRPKVHDNTKLIRRAGSIEVLSK